MTISYSFEVDRARQLVKAKLTGLFGPEHVAEYSRAADAAAASVGCPKGQHLLLVDATDLPVQQQHVVKAFQDRLVDGAVARRAAIVSGRALARMQIGRVVSTNSARVFATAEEAEAWLFSEED